MAEMSEAELRPETDGPRFNRAGSWKLFRLASDERFLTRSWHFSGPPFLAFSGCTFSG
jgi:hypothetical protein